MPISYDILYKKLRTAFPDANIDLKDTGGDSDHYELTIASKLFAGNSKLAQHRMVQAAIPELAEGKLHALAITTKSL